MISVERADPRHLDDVGVVVDELVARVGVAPDTVLVVGARCRDILHSAFGSMFQLRSTTDTDLGIAVSDGGVTKRIDAAFPKVGHTGIRYLIAGISVDIMPFGPIENPDGVSTPAPRGSGISVFGFNDVYSSALPLRLPSGVRIRIPSPAGYAALKMEAWLNRSIDGEDRDAKDLAIVCHWYHESRCVYERLWETEAGLSVLEVCEWDQDLGATVLLGRDVAGQLTPGRKAELQSRWVDADLGLLARAADLPAARGWPRNVQRRRAIFECLIGAESV